MPRNVFVGFGFGAIQGGLFLYEAHRSGNFDRLVVAEIVPEVVRALRNSGGRYSVILATRKGLERREVRGVEVFNPAEAADRRALTEAIAEATEIATALPSVDFYDRGETSVAAILAEGLKNKREPCVVYAAENHNHAAEILETSVQRHATLTDPVQFLNTVIGKMSRVVTEPEEIRQAGLARITTELPRAFLVEEFNRILITKISLPQFRRGLRVFEEKSDLLPFEEAKLYGHNAVHALLGFLASRKGYRFMSEVGADEALLSFGREAFLLESGAALIAKHQGTDPLFTSEGYRAYAEDLLERMVNPWLRDAVARVIRDPRRKLAWNDRLIGMMRLALDAGVVPRRFAMAATIALESIAKESPSSSPEHLLDSLWPEPDLPAGRKEAIKALILQECKQIPRGDWD